MGTAVVLLFASHVILCSPKLGYVSLGSIFGPQEVTRLSDSWTPLAQKTSRCEDHLCVLLFLRSTRRTRWTSRPKQGEPKAEVKRRKIQVRAKSRTQQTPIPSQKNLFFLSPGSLCVAPVEPAVSSSCCELESLSYRLHLVAVLKWYRHHDASSRWPFWSLRSYLVLFQDGCISEIERGLSKKERV